MLTQMYKRTEAQNNDQLGAMLLSIELDAENSLLSLPFAPPTRRLGIDCTPLHSARAARIGSKRLARI